MRKAIGVAMVALLMLAAWSEGSDDRGRCQWDRRAADYLCR